MFYKLSIDCPLQQKDPIQSHMLHLVIMALVSWNDFSFFAFQGNNVVKNTAQLFLQNTPQFGFSYEQVQIMHLLQEYYRSDVAVFSLHPLQWFMIFVCPITGDLFVHLIRVVPARLLHHKVTLFLIVINKVFCEDLL